MPDAGQQLGSRAWHAAVGGGGGPLSRGVVNNRGKVRGRRAEGTERDGGRAAVNGDHGSPALLARLVGNVVDNAVTHSEDGGWIEITRAADAQGTALIVDGPSSTGREVDRLAQPFERLGGERTGSPGLGLSIVTAVAAAHGAGSASSPRRRAASEVVTFLEVGGQRRAAAGAHLRSHQQRHTGRAARPGDGGAHGHPVDRDDPRAAAGPARHRRPGLGPVRGRELPGHPRTHAATGRGHRIWQRSVPTHHTRGGCPRPAAHCLADRAGRLGRRWGHGRRRRPRRSGRAVLPQHRHRSGRIVWPHAVSSGPQFRQGPRSCACRSRFRG
ncbi:ATP-binding protein [Nonomuraea insulae]|uniref:ATP-binding protein n=1 Tax=Nonomuraea insulae TaxID=1616787 RepID=A0ABW1CN27_9ACTN